MPQAWHITVETSLNVPQVHLHRLLPIVNEYIIDIKDMDPDIYKSYTDRSNRRVIDNLRWLLSNGVSDRIVVRLPLIPDYNDIEAREQSKRKLMEMGIKRFDELVYHK